MRPEVFDTSDGSPGPDFEGSVDELAKFLGARPYFFSDELSLNILKAALDSKKVRTINWNTDSYKLRNEGVPDSFKFQGSAIFITNIKFDNVKSKKMRDHLEALESRCHYIDLTIDTLVSNG